MVKSPGDLTKAAGQSDTASLQLYQANGQIADADLVA
jgi:hypothetical protein